MKLTNRLYFFFDGIERKYISFSSVDNNVFIRQITEIKYEPPVKVTFYINHDKSQLRKLNVKTATFAVQRAVMNIGSLGFVLICHKAFHINVTAFLARYWTIVI